MNTSAHLQIAGTKTTSDWRAQKAVLVHDSSPAQWESIYLQFFLGRLNTRYFQPIAILQKSKLQQGEGFSIVAIQCTLVEFLQTIREGWIYRSPKPDAALFEYGNAKSKDLFTEFLTKFEPFKSIFPRELASDFYSNVRCSLLHEAKTGNGWKISAGSSTGPCVDSNQKVVFHQGFQAASLEYIEHYKLELKTSPALQAGFVRKFDYICEG